MMSQAVLKHGFVAQLLIGFAISNAPAFIHAQTAAVTEGADGKLVYAVDERGNRIPDFSNCGYAGANREIPDVPVRIRLAPADGDDGARIQAAIDEVSRLPLDENGYRGAVLLLPGQFEVGGQIRIMATGVVLRGSGAPDDGTTVIATGTDRRPLIHVAGGDRNLNRETRRAVIDDYVPFGSTKLQLESTDGLSAGDTVFFTRPSTADWIRDLGMEAFGASWKPGTRDILWDRVIKSIDGDTVVLDAPIATAIEKQYGGATVCRYEWPSRLSQVGVEDLRLQSEFAAGRPLDEDHAWFGVVMENAQNAWVRRVEFRHFAGGAVTLWENTKWITVEDCVAIEPVSEIGGHRRRTYFTAGQLTLFLRCWSENGLQDFSVGHCAAGPNAFVNCVAANAMGDSGPAESWATGVLYDNIHIDGAGLNLANRWSTPPGAGWSAANCVLWQCRAAAIGVFRPLTANNWAIGAWGRFSGDGTIQSPSDFVDPLSLYHAQLKERAGETLAAKVGLGLADPIGSTNPTIAAAAKFTEQSRLPPPQLVDVIRGRFRQVRPRGGTDAHPQSTVYVVHGTEYETATTQQPSTEYRVPSTAGAADSKSAIPDQVPSILTPDTRNPTPKLRVHNGWLVVDGKLVTGGSMQQRFWQGTTRPDEAPAFGPAITRFVPGRVGTGFTDDLDAVAEEMLARRAAVFDHHYGLWYDRRRDDHTMGRQADGDVAAPFYEQPFARSGVGRAWDGLSKYDLTRFNPWYWNRLRDFAQLCDDRGLVLIHQNFFQHNILEAGAHWADCPWRPANNVNGTGFPEPPPYVGDKRIFLADQFYDVSNERRRAFVRGYIRQCLDNFSDFTNVIQMTSAEYSGPLEFVQFWLDTVIEWQREHGRDVLVGLSAPKNVQDAILTDARRGPHVDVIDIRYWAYTAGGELYAPDGGQNLAPRQHLRQTRQKPGGFSAIVKAVREYRNRYPEKAVTYFADLHCPSGRDGWAVMMGGGSLPDVRLPEELARAVPTMRPIDNNVAGPGQWCLGDGDGEYLIYLEKAGETVDLSVPDESGRFRVRWIDAKTGTLSSDDVIIAGQPQQFRAKTNVLWLSRLDRE
jgi:hypothetical protein